MRRLFGLLALVALLGACGSGPDTAAPGRSGKTYAIDLWYDADAGPGAGEVTLTFDSCPGEREVVFTAGADQVKAEIRRYSPSAVMDCPLATLTTTARLPEALGTRPLVEASGGRRFVPDTGGTLRLDVGSTPCGRADCSAPAAVKATCDPALYDDIVGEQLRTHVAGSDRQHCDGTFLVVTKGRRGWFVNRDATWRLVATDVGSCDEVFRTTHIRYPPAFCGG